MKRGTLTEFSELVVSVEILQHEVSSSSELFKCRAKLKDGSNLRILEKYRHDELVYYSYYWLNDANELIIGWDRALTILMSNLFHTINIWLERNRQLLRASATLRRCWPSSQNI